ncbi:hypothetical protein CDL12_03962 [Handroanthus impetiginosus]|uniref:Uncharacterized protein n=1 Tax=Handroanthus impetiginosus TaxID=429701 RepID=A0A2G9I0M4_9LAMI|nr:hypothetical protein CDL12_03962 [Handroanthus impetiginosus]
MATSCCTNCIALLHSNSNNFHNLKSDGQCFFLHPSNFERSAATRLIKKSPNRNLTIRNAIPEAGSDLLSSFSLPGIPGLSFLGDNPWLAGAAGLLVGVPLLIQRLLTLTKEVDMAAQTVEKIADVVEIVAEEVDKAAESLGEALPEGGLKKVVTFVEDLAEETAKDAQKVEDLMDKVEEIDEKVEEFLNKQVKGSTGKS